MPYPADKVIRLLNNYSVICCFQYSPLVEIIDVDHDRLMRRDQAMTVSN